MSLSCPVCGHTGLQPFAAFDNIPATGVFLREQTAPAPLRNLKFDYCPHCAFMCQRPGEAVQIDYADVARSTTRQLPQYVKDLVVTLAAQYAANAKSALTVEVGCNDGTFLDYLQQAGFTNRLGVEPSHALATLASQQGHTVVAEPLTAETATRLVAQYGLASQLICRHTLEHVPAPLSFLKALRSLLVEGGYACIEVPSFLPIIQQLHVHELWDEHISYFLPGNLQLALQQAGFVVEHMSVQPFREMQNIVVWARASAAGQVSADKAEEGLNKGVSPLVYPPTMGMQQQNETLVQCIPESNVLALCASFDTRWQAAKTALHEIVEASPRPRIGLGASHPQANFFNFSGLAGCVDGLIDDDPLKVGRFLPLQGVNVPVSSGTSTPFPSLTGTLLLSAFGYPAWMSHAEQGATNAASIVDLMKVVYRHA